MGDLADIINQLDVDSPQLVQCKHRMLKLTCNSHSYSLPCLCNWKKIIRNPHQNVNIAHRFRSSFCIIYTRLNKEV
jgi:hypothetical protein